MEKKMLNCQIKQEKIKSLKSFYENVEDKNCFFTHIAEIELMHERSLVELREKLKFYVNSIDKISEMMNSVQNSKLS